MVMKIMIVIIMIKSMSCSVLTCCPFMYVLHAVIWNVQVV